MRIKRATAYIEIAESYVGSQKDVLFELCEDGRAGGHTADNVLLQNDEKTKPYCEANFADGNNAGHSDCGRRGNVCKKIQRK